MDTKYIFVTGGVVSSIGKDIISDSLACLLKARGFSVTIQKFVPYLNLNSNPLNADECEEGYLTEFSDIRISQDNYITTGHIFQNVLNKERRGEYEGKTIQIVPHITDEIKRNMKKLGNTGNFDFVIIEIDGVAGDLETRLYLESVRQLRWELGDNCTCIHFTHAPYENELNTTITQHSVKKLQEIGLQPDIIILNTAKNITQDVCCNIASLCNVTTNAVIKLTDVPSRYEVPIKLQEQGLDKLVMQFTKTPIGKDADMTAWLQFLNKMLSAEKEISIGIIGKYAEQSDAYKSINASLLHATVHNDRILNLTHIQSDNLHDGNVNELLGNSDGVIIASDIAQRGIEGKISAAKWCREHNIPTFGINLGMQCMITEFTRNISGISDINNNVEFNTNHRECLEKAGMVCTSKNPETHSIETIELSKNNWYIGTQYHPEYSSSVLNPHPLFIDFVRTAINYNESK